MRFLDAVAGMVTGLSAPRAIVAPRPAAAVKNERRFMAVLGWSYLIRLIDSGAVITQRLEMQNRRFEARGQVLAIEPKFPCQFHTRAYIQSYAFYLENVPAGHGWCLARSSLLLAWRRYVARRLLPLPNYRRRRNRVRGGRRPLESADHRRRRLAAHGARGRGMFPEDLPGRTSDCLHRAIRGQRRPLCYDHFGRRAGATDLAPGCRPGAGLDG